MLPSLTELPDATPTVKPFGLLAEGGSWCVDAATPRLSWRVANPRSARGQRQTAYQIHAASDPDRLLSGRPDLWDSGKVASQDSLLVPWTGMPLSPRQFVCWTVRLWDREGKASDYCHTPGTFTVGLLRMSEWKARWIGSDVPPPADPGTLFGDNPAPLLRKAFTVRGGVAVARVYFVGLGAGELTINGTRVGDDVLDPPWTRFDRRIYYGTYDVTEQLRSGENVVGIVLGNGWYNPLPLKMWGHLNLRAHLPVGQPRGLLQLEIDYDDGRRDTIVTDSSWRWHDGPILRNSLYLGEQYDARKELPGWDTPGFGARGWRPVAELTSPGGTLIARPVEPARAEPREPIGAESVTTPKPGVHVVDLRENFTGVVQLRIEAPAGTRIALKSGELLHDDGTVNGLTAACGQIKGLRIPPGSDAPSTAYQTDVYTCKGGGVEVWRPRFTFHGFRYVEMTGLPTPPTPKTLRGHAVRTRVGRTTEFSCADPLLEKLFAVTRHTFESNLVHVQSDCPHREKFGYGGDIVATADTALFLLDLGRFYRKTVHDFADAVRPNGGFTETAPFVGISDAGLGGGAGPIEWGTAHPLLLDYLLRFYGDLALVEEQFPLAARWFDLLEKKAVAGILDNGLGDHETLVPRSTAVTGTAFFFWNATLLARLAHALGKRSESERYARAAAAIAAAFRKRFVDGGKVGLGSQTCQAGAIALGLLADPSAAVTELVAEVMRRDTHVTTGIFGTMWLLPALSAHGHADVAYDLARQRTFPSWGYMLGNGATTLWETWARSDNTFSNNHPMFGSVAGWMVQWLAGIRIPENARGCDRVLLSPKPPRDLGHAKASYRSVRGEIVCGWARRRDGGLDVEAEVPVGCVATVELPASRDNRVWEGDAPAERSPGVAFLSHAGGLWRAQLGSGRYAFSVQ